MLFNHAQSQCQTEPGTARAGREERFEDLTDDVGSKSRASVADLQKESSAIVRAAGVHLDASILDSFNRQQCILEEVSQNQAKAVRIEGPCGSFLFDVGLEDDLLRGLIPPDFMPSHRDELTDGCRKPLDHDGTTENEEVVHQLVEAHEPVQHRLLDAFHSRRFTGGFEDDFEGLANSRDGITDLVGQGRGHLTDHRELLLVAKLSLEPISVSFQAMPFLGLPEGSNDGLHGHVLQEEGEGALLDGRDGGLDRGIAGQDDAQTVGADLAQMYQEILPGAVRESEVHEGDVRLVLLQAFPGLRDAPGSRDGGSLRLENLLKIPGEISVVFDQEDIEGVC